MENKDFQLAVVQWLLECFGVEKSQDKTERFHRFLEEAIELAQACGCTEADAYLLVSYVFNRPKGEARQEVGGVMTTLAALCYANGFDMKQCGEDELKRVWMKIEEIRAKQASKPYNSPLPQ